MEDILSRCLRPVIRLAIARGVLFPTLSGLLKRLYVEEAQRAISAQGHKRTDSLISVMTGLQRRDIKALEGAQPPAMAPPNPLAKLVARWQAGPPYTAKDGGPKVLSRKGPAPSFDSLAAEVSRDVHPRTFLDALLDAGTVSRDADTDTVTLCAAAYVPRAGSEAQLAYLAANLGDHGHVAVENVLGRDTAFERAVHYDGLSPGALAELDAYAAEAASDMLVKVNARARELQKTGHGTGRFRLGAFVFAREEEERS